MQCTNILRLSPVWTDCPVAKFPWHFRFPSRLRDADSLRRISRGCHLCLELESHMDTEEGQGSLSPEWLVTDMALYEVFL